MEGVTSEGAYNQKIKTIPKLAIAVLIEIRFSNVNNYLAQN